MTFVVYALVDPEGERTGYIGATAMPYKRFWRHLSEACLAASFDPGNLPEGKMGWLQGLIVSGLSPIMVEVEELPEGTTRKEAYARERKWIDRWRASGWELLNRPTGRSKGHTPSAVTRAKIGEANKKHNAVISNTCPICDQVLHGNAAFGMHMRSHDLERPLNQRPVSEASKQKMRKSQKAYWGALSKDERDTVLSKRWEKARPCPNCGRSLLPGGAWTKHVQFCQRV